MACIDILLYRKATLSVFLQETLRTCKKVYTWCEFDIHCDNFNILGKSAINLLILFITSHSDPKVASSSA